MTDIRLVIFDFDGVVVDSEVISARMLVAELAQHGVQIDLPYVAQHFLGRSYPVVLAQVRKEFGITLPEGFEIDYRRRLFEAFHADLTVMPGFTDMLARLDVPYALATSSSAPRVAQSMQIAGIAPLFEGRKSIEEVDVTGRTAKGLEGEVALGDIGGSGLLVGVGAVSESAVLVAVASILLAEELGDGGIVIGSVLEGLEGVSVAAALGDLALLELLEETSVVVGVAEDGNSLVVLGGSTDKSNTTNIDFLNSLGDADVDLGDGVLEGVQVADDVVNLVDVLIGEVLLVRGEITGQDTSVDGRVQSLDATSKHLRGLGDGRNVPVKVN